MPRSITVTHLSEQEIAAGTSPVLGRIAAILRPYRGLIGLVFLAVTAAALLTAVLPFFVQATFDRALFPTDGEVRLDLLGWLVAAMIAIPVVTALIQIGQNYLTSLVGNSAMADLRSDLFAHLQRMELGFFTSTRTGAIQSRLANDVAGVRTVLTDTAASILQNTVIVVAAFVAMIILSWELTLLTVILLPLFLWMQVRVGRRRQRLARKTQESLSEMSAITEESLSVSGILLAKVFGRGDDEVERYRRENRRQTRLQVKQAMTGRAFFAVVQTFFAITPALLYLAAGFMLTGSLGSTELTAGTLVAFTTLQARLQMPLIQLMRVSLDVQTSLALFRRLFEYLDLEPAVRERDDAVELETIDGRVEFRGVWFTYPQPRALSGRTAGSRFGDDEQADTPAHPGDGRTLRGVSMQVEAGQLAAIVGPSGAGKTTITYLVPRFYDVTEGAVLVDGVDVRDLSQASLTRAIGMVTQEPYLFHGTIRDNIAYAKPGATAEEIEEAARAANVHERILSFSEGYQTMAGERGYRLSGGEKQRIAIARVMLKDPPILILDEATSSLDSATERLVQEALTRATRNRTTIAIAHRLSTIRAADVIIGLEDGQVVEQGTHDELLASGGLYARLYVEQFGGGRIETRLGDAVRYADGSTAPHWGTRAPDLPL